MHQKSADFSLIILTLRCVTLLTQKLLHKGDEIKGQADTFKQWLGLIARVLGEDVTAADTTIAATPKLNITFLSDAEVALSQGE